MVDAKIQTCSWADALANIARRNPRLVDEIIEASTKLEERSAHDMVLRLACDGVRVERRAVLADQLDADRRHQLADLFRHPGRPGEVAVLVDSERGTIVSHTPLEKVSRLRDLAIVEKKRQAIALVSA